MGPIDQVSSELYSFDRFAVNRLLTPRRWDLIVFRSQENPPTQYLKWLVGLPGDEVVVKDGGVWVNGVSQELPPGTTVPILAFGGEEANQEPEPIERSVRLGDNEYFIIDNFSLRTSQARNWGAVPATNVEGVVDVVYFPLSRWRIVR
ncbi:signal peptidase I [Fimbriiglobus ruber]|uniref:Signal peptidase I n=1 Tax=Fimbriiglobus ruber TaxID=1908690 RepID=A0A225DPE6_9BACT|nr:signal peptidase I [Fimbriiglobus ruber]OWK38037.1 Signal peptidase I [Fimbriiglobus ruber]